MHRTLKQADNLAKLWREFLPMPELIAQILCAVVKQKSSEALGNTHLCVLQLPRRKFLLMDYLKYNLTPLDEVKGEEPKTEAEKAAREELKRHRQETQRYKQKYFEYYDDVKINHREDW